MKEAMQCAVAMHKQMYTSRAMLTTSATWSVHELSVQVIPTKQLRTTERACKSNTEQHILSKNSMLVFVAQSCSCSNMPPSARAFVHLLRTSENNFRLESST